MRSRTLREGSVGLLILVGLALFGGLAFWIQGLNLGRRSYQANITFDNVAGMRPGAPVRYRGVVVGKIQDVQTASNAAEAIIQIDSNRLIIPKDVIVEANQVGLIGETSIDIFPQVLLPEAVTEEADPLAADCDTQLILCNGDRLNGSVGVSYDTLIRSTTEIADLLTETGFFDELRELTRNSADAAEGVSELTREFASLSRTLEGELGALTASAISTTDAVGQAATELSITSRQVNELIDTNRSTLVLTLENINETSLQLRRVVDNLSPAIENGELVENLQILSENAVIASNNLRSFSDTVGSPENLLMIQQTLDSARATFQNAQKITSDLDELMGDPEFRNNLRDLVDGLSGLVSSTQELRDQAQFAQTLQSTKESLEAATPQPAVPSTPTVPATAAQSLPAVESRPEEGN
ncbi:MAG: MCE family protein [Synechococcales cyanobacterium K44_A2020_017]|nr:MCE family protein [Synechococcales cyanobacterium K32_A2020_035]MBF2095248.1 MCE family protein [Synechococcales cyanobacterium K44_A2020_017]